VIARHHPERAGTQASPERFAMIAVSNRRRAFELGGAIGNVGGGKRQIVGAGFRRDSHAGSPGFSNRVHTAGRRHMNDVDVRASLSGQARHQANRIDFGSRRARRQVVAVARGPAGR
jgi:hypothetical protein